MKFTTSIIILLIFTSLQSLLAQDDLKLMRQGNKQYDQGKFKDAEITYRKATEANPKQYKATFNTGDALYKQGNYEEAAKIFESIAGLDVDKETKAKILHNLGNSYVQSKKYQEGIDAYKQSLRLNPKDEDTRYNFEYAKSKLIQQQQQQQQQHQQQQQDKQQQQQQNSKDEKEKKEQPREQNQQMTKEEAERMLNALNQNEKDLQDKLKKKVALESNNNIEKDW